MSGIAAPSKKLSVTKKKVVAPIKKIARNKRLNTSEIRQIRYNEGYGQGYQEGVQSGIQSFSTLFEGTSIVIPTYNQLTMVRQCIESIVGNTDSPYEIIVVDNASTDGTVEYLQGLGGQVRFRALENNRGFAGAINVGLMMARGRTIMLLNNDTIATVHWLDNLLLCLNSDDSIGMVGPVTNYISGEQQIPVPYQDLADMPRFARENNRSNPERWRQVERLTGFCLLFRRELFEGIGYMDEGFEIGNFEDDDYNIRVRLLGKSLVIAQDSFIHHFGSVSMKALGERFQEVNDRNEAFFIEKWHNPHELIHRVHHFADQQQEHIGNASRFYPEHVVVQAIGPNYYWIEKGQRRLVVGTLSFPAVRVSQVDLRRWSPGEPISYEEVERRWWGTGDDAQLDTGLAVLPDGTAFHIENGKLRSVTGSTALESWNLHLKPRKAVTAEMLENRAQGFPIIASPVLRQVL